MLGSLLAKAAGPDHCFSNAQGKGVRPDYCNSAHAVYTPAMLRIDNLTYRSGNRVLFDRASAVVNAGQRVGFVGRNGTGKTTLLRLITGALEPENGTVSVAGRWRTGMTS